MLLLGEPFLYLLAVLGLECVVVDLSLRTHHISNFLYPALCPGIWVSWLWLHYIPLSRFFQQPAQYVSIAAGRRAILKP